MGKIAVLLAFGGLAAAAPAVAGGTPSFNPSEIQANARRSIFDAQAYTACLSAWPPGGGDDPGSADSFADCRCAVDRYAAGRDTAELGDFQRDDVKTLLGPLFEQCRVERAAGVKAPAAATAPPIAPEAPGPSVDDAAAEAAPAEVTQEAGKSDGFDLLTLLAGTGLPPWAWAALPVGLALIVMVVATRRRRGRGDLIGPPPSMRRRAAPPPAPPPPNPNWPQ